MATSNALFASTRRSQSAGLLIAACVFFGVGVGGSSVLVSAYTGAVAHAPVAADAARV